MTANTQVKRKQQARQAAIRILLLLVILVCVNMLATRFHYGLDLTAEKRFTLSPATKKLLRNLDDVVVVNVYLKGSFPAPFQRLSEATRDRLQSFREYAGSKLVFRFINPVEGKNENEKNEIYKQLVDKGIIPMNLQAQGGEEGYSEKLVLPWALVQYKGRETPVQLHENKVGMNAWQSLNYAELLLEHKLASAINRLNYPDKKQIAYIMGNGEPLGYNTYDLLTTLPAYYKLDTFDLSSSLYIPNFYSAIVINRPTAAFDDKDKFKIDQYIMHGGRVLWAIDRLSTPMDSLKSQQFLAQEYPLNLEDQLFKYGVRVNPDLVEEFRQCLPIPIVENRSGSMQLRPWMYFPVFLPSSGHPVVKNMDYIMGMFVNSIDTMDNPEVRKTILLESTKYSRVESAPVRVSLGILNYPLDERMFSNGNKATAVLLEGKFKSVFENRLHPDFLAVLRDSIKREFKPQADSNGKMIVLADGDIMQNDIDPNNGPREMGFWQFTGQRFANKEFILNCLEYLTDDSRLIEARSKDLRLRVLDPGRLKNEKLKWQVINIGIPVALVLIFASAYFFFRKRRYEKQ